MTLFQLIFDFWFLSCILFIDISEDGEVSFRGFNVVASESFAFSAERLAESFLEDSTLIFSASNMLV